MNPLIGSLCYAILRGTKESLPSIPFGSKFRKLWFVFARRTKAKTHGSKYSQNMGSNHFSSDIEDSRDEQVLHTVQAEVHQAVPHPISPTISVNVPEDITQTCFVLGNVHTLQITHQGGTFPLHPFGPGGDEQQVECCATLEAPPGVVGSGVTVSVHYAIILDGPFKFPEKWERTSVVLYIDCPESKHLIAPLKVNLHHWAVTSGASRMCSMKSNHLLQQGQTKFSFKYHADVVYCQPTLASIYLEKHFCLLCIAAEPSAPSRYYGMLLSESLHDGIQEFRLCITYGVPSWILAVSKFYRKREGLEEYPRIPQHGELQSCGNKVTVDIENESGPGWSLVVTKNEVLLTDLKFLSKYSDCMEKKLAFEMGCYPPSAMFTVYYTSPPSLETHDQVPNVVYLSPEDSNSISFSFPVHNMKGAKLKVPSNPNLLSDDPVRVGWAERGPSSHNHTSEDNNHFGEPSKRLTVRHLMPYINDLADEVVSISGWLDMGSELPMIRRTFGMIAPKEQLQELLKKWLEDTERPTAPHTWEYFVRVVREVRKGHVADRIVEDVFTDKGSPPDPASLEKYIVSKMADYWFQFGMNLGIAEKTLQDLDKSNLIPDNVARCVVILHHYMKKAGPIENNMEKLNGAIEQTLSDSREANVTGDMVSGTAGANIGYFHLGKSTSPLEHQRVESARKFSKKLETEL